MTCLKAFHWTAASTNGTHANLEAPHFSPSGCKQCRSLFMHTDYDRFCIIYRPLHVQLKPSRIRSICSADSATMTAPASHLSVEAHHALHAALLIPHSSRPVADFLFTALAASPFHPGHVVSPHHLTHALTLCHFQELQPVPNPRYPPYAAQLSFHVPFPDHLLTFAPRKDVPALRSFHHDVFLPVASIAPSFTVGYAFCHDPTHPTTCFRANPFVAPYVARFVFDSTSNNLLCVVHGGHPASIGLKAVVNHYNNAGPDNTQLQQCAEHFQIAVPGMDYQWPHLPSKPLWVFSNIQYRTVSVSAPPTTTMLSTADPQTEADIILPFTPSVTLLDSLDDRLPSQPFPSRRGNMSQRHSRGSRSVVNYQPFPISTNGSMADGTPVPTSSTCGSPDGFMGCTSPTAEMFDLGSLQRAMEALFKCLTGSFYAPSLRADTPLPLGQFISEAGTRQTHEQPGQQLQSTFTGRIMSTVMGTAGDLTFRLRERFAHTYYNVVLSTQIDRPLTTSAMVADCGGCLEQAECEQFEYEVLNLLGSCRKLTDNVGMLNVGIDVGLEEQAVTPMDCAGKPQRQAKKIAPRRVAIGAVREDVNDVPVGKVVYSSRDEMLAARRARNRLSAARSNERKKLRVADLEWQLEIGRRQVTTLTQRQAKAQQENRLLKSQLFLHNLIEG